MAQAAGQPLDMYRKIGLYFTMGFAILAGLVWGASGLLGSSSTSDAIGSVLIVGTMIGGVVIGLLYVLHASSRKR